MITNELEIKGGSVAVVSDLHLGANSLLDLPGNLDKFSQFLKDQKVQVDTFVLLGDIFDLSMDSIQDTISRTKEFVRVISTHCKNIVYIPGNHDHHLWFLSNEIDKNVSLFPTVKDQEFIGSVDSFVSRISDIPFSVSYPNAYWTPPNGETTFVFHHGHFCDATYSLVSDVFSYGLGVDTKNLEAIEGINAGWLEFVWYNLCQTGDSNDKLIEALYYQIIQGNFTALDIAIKNVYQNSISPTIHNSLAGYAQKHWWFPKLLGNLVSRVADWVLPKIIVKIINQASITYIENGTQGASSLRGSVLEDDLATECIKYLTAVRNSNPELKSKKLTLVFGHTHKFGMWPRQTPEVFNTGGWTLDGGLHPDSYIFKVVDTGFVNPLLFSP